MEVLSKIQTLQNEIHSMKMALESQTFSEGRSRSLKNLN